MAADWTKIKAEYFGTEATYKQLCDKYGVSYSTLSKKAMKEKWAEKKEKGREKLERKASEALQKKEINRLERISNITDKLLDKIEISLAELDKHLATKTKKEKHIEYGDPKSGGRGRPTKEVIYETEEVISYQDIIDRAGLKQITSALKDLKEIQIIRTPLDDEEQRARIEKLRKDTEQTAEDNGIVIEIGEAEGWSE